MAPSLLYRETATAFAAATGAATGVACALNYAIQNYRIGEVRTISAILPSRKIYTSDCGPEATLRFAFRITLVKHGSPVH